MMMSVFMFAYSLIHPRSAILSREGSGDISVAARRDTRKRPCC
jgi:hypothetical protein